MASIVGPALLSRGFARRIALSAALGSGAIGSLLVVDAGSGVSADLRGRKVMAIMIKGAYAQFAVAQTIMTGEWRPERHNQGECCCDASTEPHTRGAQDAPGTPMSRRHRPGSAQLMDYTCANPPSTNNSVPVM